jgi:hypothetical protein
MTTPKSIHWVTYLSFKIFKGAQYGLCALIIEFFDEKFEYIK